MKLATTPAERTGDVTRASAYASEFAVAERMRLGDAIRFALEEKMDGEPVSPRTTRVQHELGAREVEVGRLVADGLTNKKSPRACSCPIARLSRTVRHILNKFGLRFRVQIASRFQPGRVLHNQYRLALAARTDLELIVSGTQR